MLSFIFLLKQVNLCKESFTRGGWRCSSVCALGRQVGRIEREEVELRCMERGQRRQWHPTPVLLPGKSHGWRSLLGCSPWGHWRSDMTERLHFHFSLSCIGEGNGNPLQCSCLENPRHWWAWWAAVHGVATSQTQLSDFTFTHWRRKWQPTPVFFPGETQGRESLVGCHLWGCTESDTTEAT